MRLDKHICLSTALTRSQARECIRSGLVRVDGFVTRDAAMRIGREAVVTLEGSHLSVAGPRYLMLNKPAGCVCSTTDPGHITVVDLLPPELRTGLHPAGRLDLDATGLVLLTDDGAWSHRITAPGSGCSKTYRVHLAEPLQSDATARLECGIQLRGEPRPTRPARLQVLAPTEVRITLTEGRYHQVKRMFAALGNRVCALHRERIGSIALDRELEAGAFRPLTRLEINGVVKQ